MTVHRDWVKRNLGRRLASSNNFRGHFFTAIRYSREDLQREINAWDSDSPPGLR
jgi:hypothetical protein